MKTVKITLSEHGFSFTWLFACSLYEACLEVWQKACTFFIMRGKVKIFGTVTHRNHIYGDSQIKFGQSLLSFSAK